MEFIEHTLNWIKGEIFEARIILIFGIITVICAFLFWKIGTTPSAKVMLFPLLAVGIMFTAIGGGMLNSNPKREVEFSHAYKTNPHEFIQSEKERVETFMSWYPITRYIMAGLAILGIVLFLFWATPIGRAIGISLILMGLATFVVDHFSEERADIYYQKIEEAIK